MHRGCLISEEGEYPIYHIRREALFCEDIACSVSVDVIEESGDVE